MSRPWRKCARCGLGFRRTFGGRQTECAECHAYSVLVASRAACKAYYARRHRDVGREVEDAFRDAGRKPARCVAMRGYGPD